MKAVLCREFGSPRNLSVGEVESFPARAGEVKVRVRACGVNFPDLLMVQGLYQLKPELPFSPGLEVAGEIAEVGEDVRGLAVGQRVMGLLNYGGFAEEVLLPQASALPMPDSMPYEHAAAFPVVYGTSHMGLDHRAHLQPGETLLVLGAAGGVGLTAVELGKLMGATVIAAASSEEKCALARDYGADHTINYSEQDIREAVKTITRGQFADVIYDPVGGDAFDAAVRCLAWEGRYLVIGFASGRIPELAVNRLLLKNSSLVGLFWGAYMVNGPEVMQRSFQTLLGWYAEGRLKPHIDRTYPLAEAGAALQALANRRTRGKLVLLTG